MVMVWPKLEVGVVSGTAVADGVSAVLGRVGALLTVAEVPGGVGDLGVALGDGGLCVGSREPGATGDVGVDKEGPTVGGGAAQAAKRPMPIAKVTRHIVMDNCLIFASFVGTSCYL